jgi:cation diffusion facilitator family transporter
LTAATQDSASQSAIDQANGEKAHAARSSVFWAVFLTGLKIFIGLATGSLGILAEAAHSGFDLLAAIMTWLAVRLSARPADHSHPYGHGKVENLSALFETLLLLGTCVWIIIAATNRLIHQEVDVEVTVWSFAVMATSIVVDISRSRMLYRAARKHRSHALEADALHFSTDVWSSAVVIVGLVGVVIGDRVPRLESLHYADAVAAILVAAIVVQVSIKLGLRTVSVLMDSAPEGLEEKIVSTVEAIQGVTDCHRVRLRYSGPQLFVDLHVLINGDETFRRVHDLTEVIERAIGDLIPNADVTVHPEPA